MSYREKKAWITLFCLLGVFSVYAVFMVRAYHVPEPNYNNLAHLLLLAIIAFILFELALLFIAARIAPLDPKVPGDERELLIELKTNRIAYFVLIALILIVTFPMIHVHGRNWGFGNLYLGALVLAELVRFTLQIIYFRREA
jgi:hypothetical protein